MYEPKQGDEVRFQHAASFIRKRVYRVDQVVLTDEGEVLGVVISTQNLHHPEKRIQYIYDLYTFLGFDPVKIDHAIRDDDTTG